MNKQIRFGNALLSIRKIMKDCGQKFFLIDGTLLGLVREGKFIEYDDDIDLGIFHSDLIPKLRREIVKSGEFSLIHKLGKRKFGYELSFYHHLTKTKIDIFVFYNDLESEKYWYATYFGRCRKKKYGCCRYFFDKFDLIKVKFIGKKFYIPFSPEKYLVQLYGNDWMIPKKYNYSQGIKKEYKNIVDE